MTRTYGTLRHGKLATGPDTKFGTAAFEIRCEPHVAVKVKRIFPRANQGRARGIFLTDTPDVARDIEWLLDRYPLEVAPDVHAHLTARADEHRAAIERTESILAGGTVFEDHWLVPARPLRPYQQIAADLAHTRHRMLLGDDVGLGKTTSTLAVLRDPETRPALVVTLTHLPQQWLRELNTVFPDLTGHVVTKTKPYDVDADVLIMGYSKLAGWGDHLPGQVRTVIFDEVQELRRDGTMKHDAAARIADKADWVIGASATPVFNYGGEIHNIFTVIDREALGSRTEFVREWGAREWNGHVSLGDPGALGTYLRDESLLLRRTRADVKRELPDTVRVVQNCDADPTELAKVESDVAAMAKLILDAEAKGKDRFQAAGEIDWKLRQATGIAKAPYVAEFVRLLLQSERSVVLFGWHRAVYALWAEALAEYNPKLYTGTESPTQKEAAAQAFISGDSRVLMMSLRAGAGLDGLQTACSTAVFGELDWSPEVMNQAIGRLARDGQESPVAAYFMLSDAGSDPVMAEVNEIKRQQAEPIRDPNAPLVTSAASNADRIKLLAQSVVNNTQEF